MSSSESGTTNRHKRSVSDFFSEEKKKADAVIARMHSAVMSPEGVARQAEEFFVEASKEVKKELGEEELVDGSRFDSTVVLENRPEDKFEILREENGVEPEPTLPVSFVYNNNWDKSRLKVVPDPGTKLFLQLYTMEMNDFSNPDWAFFYASELKALVRIEDHNLKSDKKIGLPVIYDYGRMTFAPWTKFKLPWFFILMSYVEDEQEAMSPEEVECAHKRIEEDIKTLEELGIHHGWEEGSYLRINRTNPMLVNYFHVYFTQPTRAAKEAS